MAPLLIAPRAGRLADQIGDRPLIVSGLALQGAALAWIAIIAGPQVSYAALVAPLFISGAGLGLAIPAVTKAVVGSVPPGDIGKASGVFSTMRQLGGAFGVAILAAVFTVGRELRLGRARSATGSLPRSPPRRAWRWPGGWRRSPCPVGRTGGRAHQPAT